MKYWRLMILVMGCIILQSTLVPFLKIINVHPDIVLMVIIAISVLLGFKMGTLFGFIAGLLLDISTGGTVGIYASVYTLIGFSSGLMEKKVFKDNFLLPLVFCFVGTFIKGFLEYILLRYSGISVSFISSFGVVVFPEAIYNAIMAPFVYYLIYRLPIFKYLRMYPYGII